MSSIPIEFIVPLLVFGLKGAGAVNKLVKNRRRLRACEDAAEMCGLQVLETSGWWSPWSPRLTARAGPMMVTLGKSEDYTQIVLRGPVPPSLHTVRIRRESRLRRGPEIEIGDPSFDSTFFIEGPVRQVLSLLDAEMRDLMIRANKESRLEISTGTLQAELPDEMVPSFLPLLVDLGRRLAQPMNVPWCLAENAHRDPEPGVRLRNLLVLARELPGEPWTIEALRTACSDPSPEVRLRAAQELGTEGRGLLLDLAESLVDDAVSAEAVSILDRELSFERTQAILDLASGRRLLKTARACLEALGRSGDAVAVDALAKVMALEQGELASAAALALGATGSPAAEPPLIRALQREQADLRMAAANALGRVGTAAAVLPLEEAAERSWLDRELHQAARQAIAEIQSRLPGASPGQLSLPRTEVGQLSLTDTEAGRLSLATDPAGNLSIVHAESGPFALPREEPEQPPHRDRETPAGRPV